MCYNHHLLVHCLHQWEGKHGDLVLLPPVFSTDPALLILLPVGYIGELWLNDIFNTPVAAGGTGLGKARPTISRLSCCHQEVIAGKTLADWMESERVVYPSPPIVPTPKDGETDKSDDSNNEPADGDKGEQCGGSGEDDTPNKKEDQKSEGESDDQLKAPKDPTAVSGDSGLGTSSPGDGVGAGATVGTVANNPSINPSTGLPCLLSFR